MKKKRVSPAPTRLPKPVAVTKPPASKTDDVAGFSFAAVRELAQIAVEFDLVAIEAKPGGVIRITRRGAGDNEGQVVGAARPMIGPPTHLTLAPPAAPEPLLDAIFVTSPFVGTFYRAASPEAPAFTDVGQSVRKGQAVCIIEAMKLMNEIEAEADGKVVEVLAKNGDHVEYGQPLFRLQKA